MNHTATDISRAYREGYLQGRFDEEQLHQPWISVKDRLPDNEYDWVLVQCKMNSEGWYGLPHIAELRHGVWYCTEVDNPLEETLSVIVTHWMPLPKPPERKEESGEGHHD